MDKEKSLAEKVLSVVGTGEVPGGSPKPLKTNWPYPDCKDIRKTPETKFFIDDPITGETIITYTDEEKALDYIDKFGGIIRDYAPTVLEMDAELAERRGNKNLGLYFVD
jgi:hypothetical protein